MWVGSYTVPMTTPQILSAYCFQCTDGREGLALYVSCQGCIGKRRQRMGKAIVMTDKDRQDIRRMAVVLCQRAAALCTHMRTQCTSLEAQRAQLAARRYRLQALVRQQRSMGAA